MCDSVVFSQGFRGRIASIFWAFLSNCQGFEISYRTSLRRVSNHEILCLHRHSLYVSFSKSRLVHMSSYKICPKVDKVYVTRSIGEKSSTLVPAVSNLKELFFSSSRAFGRKRFQFRSVVDVASTADVINDLGLDSLTFLAVTVLIVPAFRELKASPILGFFFAGVVLNQFGFIRNLTDVKLLSEWGILFLLFEMGLELSLARLKALAKFAFGMGLTQVLLCTLAFTAFELPPNAAVGTKLLEFLFHSRPDLVNIRSVDEAIVIGAALSLSSSAFVLQLLAEKGELPTRFGSATLGILLLQDIVVVPLLVILPVLESQNLGEESIWPTLLKESLVALGGLGLLSLGGKFLLRRVFEKHAARKLSLHFACLQLLGLHLSHKSLASVTRSEHFWLVPYWLKQISGHKLKLI